MVVGPWGQADQVAVLVVGMESGYDLGYLGEAVEKSDLTEWEEVGRVE